MSLAVFRLTKSPAVGTPERRSATSFHEAESDRAPGRSRVGAVLAGVVGTLFVTMLVGRWVSVGSTSFDDRSFRLNDEANLNVLAPAFAARPTRTFEADEALSRRVSLAEWTGRPWKEKVLERMAGLLRSQM